MQIPKAQKKNKISFISHFKILLVSILSTIIILSTQPTPKVILSTQLYLSIRSQSLDFTAFDRIINIRKPPLKCRKSLEIKAFSHTYFSTLDINTTHSTYLPLSKLNHIPFYFLSVFCSNSFIEFK